MLEERLEQAGEKDQCIFARLTTKETYQSSLERFDSEHKDLETSINAIADAGEKALYISLNSLLTSTASFLDKTQAETGMKTPVYLMSKGAKSDSLPATTKAEILADYYGISKCITGNSELKFSTTEELTTKAKSCLGTIQGFTTSYKENIDAIATGGESELTELTTDIEDCEASFKKLAFTTAQNNTTKDNMSYYVGNFVAASS